MRILILAATGLLGACATVPSQGAAPVRQVTFETTPCFGACPVFSLTIDADGNGVYRGGRFVAQKGEHRFHASAAEMQAFLDRLQPFRPEGEAVYNYGHCSAPVATDSPSVKVTWESGEAADSLDWYLGCREPSLAKIKPDLYGAWQELPLDDLVGMAENRFEYDQRGG